VAAVTVGLTLDTGAVLALVGRRATMTKVFDTARHEGLLITVPAVVISEAFRAPNDRFDEVMRGVTVEPLDKLLAKEAGAALAAIGEHVPPPGGVPCALTVDAIVMASAARRGDVVYTSDPDDLSRLREYFVGVRVILRA